MSNLQTHYYFKPNFQDVVVSYINPNILPLHNSRPSCQETIGRLIEFEFIATLRVKGSVGEKTIT